MSQRLMNREGEGSYFLEIMPLILYQGVGR
jgi:hypothetical protein